MTIDTHARLRETHTFRGRGLQDWQSAKIGIIGCGTIGSRLAPEAVRSGADVWLCDFEDAEPHNIGTQAVRAGQPKVKAVIRACNAVREGAATGVRENIRHVGIGVLRECDVLVDATDDRNLAYPLTEISNGLAIPLLRVAVDGSGTFEMGRVLCSDARDGGSCQMCTRTLEEIRRRANRTPCPGVSTDERPPTLAGGALAASITGLALLQCQRLVTGNDLELVRNREVIVDFTHFQMMAATVHRSPECVSGHVAWSLIELPADEHRRLRDIIQEAERRMETDQFSLEVFGHAICLEANCECGAHRLTAGTVWAAPPDCRWCGAPMTWNTSTQRMSITKGQAAELQILDCTLGDLGLPETGAMFVARAPERPTLRLLLN